MADAGIYPAIDIESSISRAMTNIVADDHYKQVSKFRKLYSVYQENRDLVSVGAYQPGSNPELDQALKRWPKVVEFLRQHYGEKVSMENSLEALEQLLHTDAAEERGSR
jgi:flagellum-specific ATP synthase